MAGVTRPLLPLAAVTAGLASGSSLAAEWTFTPTADLFTQTQQNPRLVTDENSKHDISNGVAATAGLGMQRRTEITTLTLTPLVRAYRFDDDNNLDRDEEQLDSSFTWLGEKVSWNAGANAVRDTTLTSELGSTGLTQGNFRHESWDISVGPTWMLSERWQLRSKVESYAHRYPDQQLGLLDYGYSTALLATTYVVNEKIVLSLFGTAGKLDSKGDDSDTDDKSANVSVQYTWSPQTELGASLGRSWVTSDGAGVNRGLLYSVTASHAFEKSSLAFSVSRRQAPSGRALLTQADEAQLSVMTQITERLSATAEVGYTRRRNVLRLFNIDLQEVRYARAALGLAWRMAPNWRATLAASGINQQVGSDFFEDDLTARGYTVSLGFSWSGDPYVR